MENIQQIWPKWEPIEVIGRGGFGTVYKAKRENFGEVSWSAIKVVKIPNDEAEIKEMTTSGLSKDHIKDYYKKSVLSLLEEIKLMEKMKSASHIVSIEDYEVVENGLGWKVYIRMELLTNIADYFMNKEIKIADVKKLGVDILTALEFCHAQNLVHRDIKPGNIFVSSFGEYKLGDFGISREVEKTNATLSQKGTKSYMAPEMVRMEKYGKNVDLYALGLTMYELLNHGRMPFLPPFPEPFYPQDREEAMVKRLMGNEFPDIEGIGELNHIIKKACHANPSMRYQNAKEMKEDLMKIEVNTATFEDEKTQMGDFNLFGNNEKTESNLFKNDEKTMFNQTFVNKEDKTMGIFSNQFLFEETKQEKKSDFIFKDTKDTKTKFVYEEKKSTQNLQALTIKCPHCGKIAYLVAPNVYICNECWKMVRLNSDDKTINLNNLYVNMCNNADHPKEQLECALQMLQIAPEHGQINNRVGLYYGKLGNIEKRDYYYAKALEYDPRDAIILNNNGIVNIDKKDYWKALDYLTKADEAHKNGQTSLWDSKNTILINKAICYENTGQFLMAFQMLINLYRNKYDSCTYLTSQHKIGRGHGIDKINKLINQKTCLPKCAVYDKKSLENAKTIYNIAGDDEVLLMFYPKLLFGGKKQGMAFTTRAFYFHVGGEATFIPYYRLGDITWKADWQGHIQFKFKDSKSAYDIQFAKDSNAVVEFMNLFTKELGIFTFTSLGLDKLFSKKK